MRLFAVTASILLFCEILLFLAFLLGYVLTGIWLGGLLLCLALLLLMILPWLGNLQVDFDSGTKRMNIRMAWWGKIIFSTTEPVEMRIRILGFPFRKKLEPRKKKGQPLRTKMIVTARLTGWAKRHLKELSQIFISGLDIFHLLFWEAKIIRADLNSATGNIVLDRIISGIADKRKAGPLVVRYSGDGEKRIRLHYEIGMLNAFAAGLQMIFKARLPKVLTSLKKETEDAERSAL